MKKRRKELNVARSGSSLGGSSLAPGAQRDELEGLTVDTLRALAAKLGVQKPSRLRKSALIDAILAVGPQNPDPRPRSGNGKASTDTGRFSFVVLGPRRIFASWDLDARDLERARTDLGDADAVVVLRIHDRTLIEFDDSRTVATFDVDVRSPAGNYYLNDLFPGRSYQGVLGLRTSGDCFHAFAESEILETPRERASSVTDRRAMEVRGAPSQRWHARAEPPARDGWSVAPIREPIAIADATVVADAAVEVGRRESPESSQSAARDTAAEASAVRGAAAVATEATIRPESSAMPRGASEARLDVELAGFGLSSMALTGAAGDLPSSLSLAEMRERGIGVSSLGLLPLVDRAPGSVVEGLTGGVQVEASEEKGALRLDVHADLVVYGRTEPGAVLYVDNVRVPVREDGTFDARFALSRPERGEVRASEGTGESE